MLSDVGESMPIIFLVTDGAVEDERQICEFVKSHLTENRKMCPRLYTFGIGIPTLKTNGVLCVEDA